MDNQKLNFITTGFLALLKCMDADAKGNWGKMNAQQMVEHVSGFFMVSTNKIHFPLVTPLEHLPKYKEFLRTEKEFRENTRAPVLPEEPMPVKFASLEEAVRELEKEINEFVQKFAEDPNLITQHPVFGDLNFEEWVLLHYKHVVHHAKQFGLLEQKKAEV